MKLRTCRFISVSLLMLYLLPLSTFAQEEEVMQEVQEALAAQEKIPLLAGVAVSADLCGLFMKITNSRFANMEAACRLDFKEKYFPIFELGIGDCTREGGDNNNSFSTTAPYFRVGMDYNFNKKMSGNRFFAGLRYAFTSFDFDFKNPDFVDPYWNVQHPLNISKRSNTQWMEIVVGIETKIWSIIRFGWKLRYRGRIHQSGTEMGEPWYVPGFGRNGGTAWGGTVDLAFDVGKTAKSNKQK